MALNFPGPYEVRINYSVTVAGQTLQHQQRLNFKCNPVPTAGDPFNSIAVERADGTTQTLQTLVDNWITVLRPMYASGVSTFIDAEAWKYLPGTFEASYISSYAINLAGTSATGAVAAGQAIMTFRTLEGGIMKVSLMESSIAVGPSRSYTAMTSAEQDIANAVFVAPQKFLGRDTSYPFSVLRLHPGTNEALFKKRYRLN